MKPALRVILLLLAGLLLGASLMCLPLMTGALPQGMYPAPPGIPQDETVNPLECALRVAVCIQGDDFAQLSAWVHPEKGVMFTPYSTVDPERDLTFTAADVAGFAFDKRFYLWGLTDAEGAPIQMTALDYIHRYVGGRDYTHAPMASVGNVLKTGNSVENVAEAFPGCVFVELHIPQVDPKLEGLDWSSLKVVFEEYQGRLKVVALIHSEWTI